MVRALHAAGLEVILDVVFNHTAEGSEWGPTLCFRGIDNAAYYRLQDDRSRYVDDTGCGNTVDLYLPQALRLVMDALRYWVQDMHVDGFRFDLAASLGRAGSDFDPYSSFLEAVGQDPVLVAGQADRRAVGHRRLRRRTVPGRLERMERQVSRHGPRLLALDAPARCPISRRASAGPATSTATAAGDRPPR